MPRVRSIPLLFALVLSSFDARASVAGPAGTWTIENLPGPGAKGEHMAAYDPVGDRMVMFGNLTPSSGTTGNDETWILNFEPTPEWTLLNTATKPAGRSTGLMVYDSQHHRMLLFGGYSGDYLNDVWQLDLESAPTWSQVSTIGATPEGRHHIAGIYDPVDHQLVVIGGYRGGPTFDDVWTLALDGSPAWHHVDPSGPQFPPTFGHSAAYDPQEDRILVTGGDLGADVWELRLRPSPVWAKLPTVGASFSQIYYRSSVFDPVSDRLLMFGGHPANNTLWEVTFTSGAAHWTQLTPVGMAPGHRYLHSAILRSPHGAMVVYGGKDPSSQLTYSETAFLTWAPPRTLTTDPQGQGSIARFPDRSVYEEGAIVELTAHPSTGWSFGGWSGDASGNSLVTSVVMDADKSVTATFVQNAYELTLATVGGGVIEHSPIQSTYLHGEQVTVVARPHPGWIFGGWSGDLVSQDSSAVVLMDGDKSIVAAFLNETDPLVEVLYPNTMEILGVGSPYKFAWSASDDVGVTSVDVELSRDNGTTFEPLLLNAPNSGTLIWTLTGPGTNTSETPVYSGRLRVTARDQAGNVGADISDHPFAIYDLTPDHTLELSSIGQGVVTPVPDSPRHEHGSVVQVTAQPAAGWEFVAWSGDTAASGDVLEVPMNRNRIIAATFRDRVAPEVALVYPDGGELLFAGSRYKLAWSASDLVGVSQIDLAVSRDSGSTWSLIAEGLPNTGTHVWLVSRPGSNLGGQAVASCLLRVTARDSAGNESSDISSAPFSIHDLQPLSVETSRSELELRAVEPNPVREDATFHYQVPGEGWVRISLHDPQGRLVARIHEGRVPAGIHQVRWSSSSGSLPGVYFVVLRTPEAILTRKVVLAP